MSYLPIQPGVNMAIMDVDLNKYNDDMVVPLIAKVEQIIAEGGKDGREVQLANWKFPVDAPDDDATLKAIIWRYIPKALPPTKEGETPTIPTPMPDEGWELLVYLHEITGPEGPEGDKGEQGTGLNIAGVVEHERDLTLLPVAPPIGAIYLLNGKDFLFCYRGPVHTSLHGWINLGPIIGIKGPTGPRGPRGPKGDGASIGSFLLQWILGTVTNAAVTAAVVAANDAVTEAVNAAIGEMEAMATSAAEEAVGKAIEDLGDEFRGEKGEKGDKGDDGKDGKSMQMVGSYQFLSQFLLEYPLVHTNVGKAALIGEETEGVERKIYCILESAIGVVKAEDMGNIRGPKGEAGKDATWDISIRDKSFTEKMKITIASKDEVTPPVAGMYVQESDSIVLHPTSGSAIHPDQVGFKIAARYPIPELRTDIAGGLSTQGKILSNDGANLTWIDKSEADVAKDKLLISSPNGTVFAITVDNHGRLSIEENI